MNCKKNEFFCENNESSCQKISAELAQISRTDKLKILGQLDDELLDVIYKGVINNSIDKLKEQEKSNSSVHIKKPKTDKKVDKEDEKYKLVLEFLNALLVKLGKSKIDDITKFQNIKRDELLKPECTQVLGQYLDRFTKEFGKRSLRYELRGKTNSYVIMVIKRLGNYLGYIFESKKKAIMRKIKNTDSNYKFNHWIIYSFKNGNI